MTSEELAQIFTKNNTIISHPLFDDILKAIEKEEEGVYFDLEENKILTNKLEDLRNYQEGYFNNSINRDEINKVFDDRIDLLNRRIFLRKSGFILFDEEQLKEEEKIIKKEIQEANYWKKKINSIPNAEPKDKYCNLKEIIETYDITEDEGSEAFRTPQFVEELLEEIMGWKLLERTKQ